MAFLSPQADLGRLLTSPQFGLQSPLALFASPRPALKEGRLSFDVLLAEHDGQQTAQGVLEGMGAPRDAQIKGEVWGARRRQPQPALVLGRDGRGGACPHPAGRRGCG